MTTLPTFETASGEFKTPWDMTLPELVALDDEDRDEALAVLGFALVTTVTGERRIVGRHWGAAQV